MYINLEAIFVAVCAHVWVLFYIKKLNYNYIVNYDNFNMLCEIKLSKIMKWREWSRTTKYSVVFHSIGFLTNNIYNTYNNGKSSLLLYREDGEIFNNELNYGEKVETEWNAIKYGCNKHRGIIFWDSLVWPYRVLSSIIPSIVFSLNYHKR